MDILRLVWLTEEVHFRIPGSGHYLTITKGKRSSCEDHRGINLLCVAPKLLATTVLQRLFVRA